MADVRLYDAVEANIVVDGRIIQGFQDGDMFSYTFKEEKVKTAVDAHGDAAIAINNNHLATVTINLTGNSVDHKYLNDIANANKQVTLQITSEFEKVSGNQAYLSKVPVGAFGKVTPNRTYTFVVLDMRVQAL